MTDIRGIAFPDGEATDWAALLHTAVTQTLNDRLARLEQRNASTRAHNLGIAAKEGHSVPRRSPGTPDPVSKPCQPPTTPQVTDPSPDTQTGENDSTRSHP